MAGNKISKGFDRLSPFYDSLAGLVFGKSLQRSQINHLPKLPAGKRILVLGGGTGWLIDPIQKAISPEKIVWVDISPEMIQKARKSSEMAVPGSAIQFICGSSADLPAGLEFDIIITNFYLDLFDGKVLREEIDQVFSHLAPGGFWHITDFIPGRGRIYDLLIWSMIRFFRLVCGIQAKKLEEIHAWIAEVDGMNLLFTDNSIHSMIQTDIWQKDLGR